ncbi:hypothetical protein N657DRAFT_334915 [Parathielavia appendiculata]|uniref:Uncharacterized protein n=1 Tax=Parathielavia appendiculata TaxID=2587402 RepID=A0AAN6Z4N2_9PEZI|nr:hypothetical protein N657DRAFT_334915 [Parathielavia appendiculata]
MDVESITVAKDQSFGCVMGVLKAGCCSPTPSFRRSTEDHSRAGSGAGASAESRREGTHRNDGGDDDDREDGGGRDGGGEDGGDRNKEDKHEVGSERRGKGPPRGRIEMPFCGVWRFDEMGRAVEHWENAASPETLVNWLRGK